MLAVLTETVMDKRGPYSSGATGKNVITGGEKEEGAAKEGFLCNKPEMICRRGIEIGEDWRKRTEVSEKPAHC